MSKIKVPEGMLEAAVRASGIKEGYEEYAVENQRRASVILEAALLWLSENPIRMSVPMALEVLKDSRWRMMSTDPQQFAVAVQDAQRRMFLAPEQGAPIDVDGDISKRIENIEDALTLIVSYLTVGGASFESVLTKIEAFRRGQKAGSK